ncbi:hypothetical protein KIN20_028049 [Parelaphostrongylus tenuis]|uniref:Uncharacterized protein n=1 Tax=Parelaphostrongylus tenuis TaxID=148309 RepID=A0AAD5R087_PARTN|nr:hypothetical protein KIN20_028049 [Parelaphostrongylus tenuis]
MAVLAGWKTGGAFDARSNHPSPDIKTTQPQGSLLNTSEPMRPSVSTACLHRIVIALKMANVRQNLGYSEVNVMLKAFCRITMNE